MIKTQMVVIESIMNIMDLILHMVLSFGKRFYSLDIMDTLSENIFQTMELIHLKSTNKMFYIIVELHFFWTPWQNICQRSLIGVFKC